MSVEDMAGEETTVFAARDVETGTLWRAARCCVTPNGIRRGQAHVHATRRPRARHRRQASWPRSRTLARYDGFTRLMLETGNDLLAAERSTSEPVSRCGPVLDYPDTPHSAFFEKPLLSSRATRTAQRDET
jgi:putative acetyltransferase